MLTETQKLARAERNKALIGKTIYWNFQKEDWIGMVEEVKDHETVFARDGNKTLHSVNIFDIYQTS